MTGQIFVLHPDGTHRLEELAPEFKVLQQLYRLIGCHTVDVVQLAADLDMWVDDEGMVTGQPVNPMATKLAAAFGLGYQPYVGATVFAAHDDDGNTIGLTQKRIDWLAKFVATTTAPAGDRR